MRTLLLSPLLLCASVSPQDLVLHGGKVWTGDRARPEAEAVVISGERVRFVGGSEEALALAGERARRIDLRGRRVVPGFIDAHVHFLSGGDEILAPDLRSAKSEEELARRLGDVAARVPKGTWLTSGAWDHENWPEAALPTREVLDRFTPEHPVFVSRIDGHMAAANSLAIKTAGVTAQTQDPPGGTIVRDPKTKEPAGVFKDAAMELVSKHVPPWSDAQRRERARAALRHAASLGVTGVHDMLESHDALETYQELRAKGALTARITVHTPIATRERWGTAGVRRGFGDSFLKINGVKGFADGSLGSTTALFFEPYLDAAGTSGLALAKLEAGEEMEQWIASSLGLGLQPAIHAIGDRANRSVLDIFERLAPKGIRALRPRIEHAQHLHADDVARFGKLGVIASMQPYHAIDDGRWAEKRIGAPRCETTYAFRDLIDRGALLAFGSDWPVAPLSPLLGIHAAVTRETLDGRNPKGWIPRQKITVEEALRAYTAGGAYAAFDEYLLGSLVPGKLADLVVLDTDVLSEGAKIGDVRVDLTMVGGRIVFERPPAEAAALEPAIVSRDRWGADLADERAMRAHVIERITVHHSGVKVRGWPEIDGPAKMRGLLAFSQRDKGWPDVPYHYCVGPDGTVYEGRDPRFAGDTNTAYETAGHLLIEAIGHFDEDDVPGRQLEAIAALCAWGAVRYGVPLERLKGHRDFAETSCPGAKLQEKLTSGELARRVRTRLSRVGVAEPGATR